MALKYCLFCVIITFFTSITLATVFENGFEDELDKFVKTTMDCRHVPGMTLSVVKGSDTWAKGYGTADFSTKRAVDNTTLFGIGSITKSFTVTLLGILLTEKKLDWSAKVVDILGSGYSFVDEYRTREMTLRDMLSHRTGLARLDVSLISGIPNEVSRELFCRRMKYLPEQRPFRDSFIYNNFMYMMLGHVAEKLGGNTWENLVTSKVLQPIGMTSTKLLKSPDDVLKESFARPYIYKDDMFQNGSLQLYSLHPAEPAGAIMSSAEDMAKYLRFHINYGTTDDGTMLVDLKLMSEVFKTRIPVVDQSFEEAQFFTKPEFPISNTPIGYGYAWFTSTYNGYVRYWHSGGMFSYISLAWIFPEIKAGIFASVSGPGVSRLASSALHSILYHISDNIIGDKPWINETTTCQYPDLWRQKTTNSTPDEPLGNIANPREYVGRYGNGFFPAMEVKEIPGNRTVMAFQMNKLGGVLYSTKDNDRFLLEITSPWELMESATDKNNITIKSNATFLRSAGEVTTLSVQFEVKVNFTKGVDILDTEVSGASLRHTMPAVIVLIAVSILRML